MQQHSINYQWTVSKFFNRQMGPTREKLASRELFATVYTTLLVMSDYLMNIN